MSTPFDRAAMPPDYLDRVAATDVGKFYKQRMLDLTDARSGDTVLDLGCGPGTDLRSLAEAVGPTGSVIGIDNDVPTIAKAHERTTDIPWVGTLLGDIHTLPFVAGSIDRARTDRVLQHAADPLGVLVGVHRVLRTGGLLVMGEPDWSSLTIRYHDAAVASAYNRFVSDHVVRHAAIGGELTALAAEAGFTIRHAQPVRAEFTALEAAEEILGIARTSMRAVQAGYLTVDEGRQWLERLAAEPFSASMSLHIVVAVA